MVTSYLEPVTAGTDPDQPVFGDDGLVVTVGGPVPCDEPVTDFDRVTLVYGDDGDVVTVCGPPVFGFGRLLENDAMVTDMDCRWHSLIKIGHFIPVPFPLISSDDPRLSDARNMLPGSVFNVSVAGNAAIDQSKLNLNGDIPPQYLMGMPNDPVTTEDFITLVTGDDSATVTVGGFPPQHDAVTTGALVNPNELVTGDDGAVVIVTGSGSGPTRLFAAPGDDAEYKSNKGIPNGYVPLDANRRMPLSMYPVGAPAGTLNSLTLNIDPAFMVSVPRTVTNGSVTMAGNWINIDTAQWFGTMTESLGGAPPIFRGTPMYRSTIPSLSTAKFVSGVFDPDLMPVAVGVGHPDHAAGVLPDPGDTGAPDDYLARDMTYKTMRAESPYENMVPDPSIVIVSYTEADALVTVTDTLPDVSLFYRLNYVGQFAPLPSRPFPAPFRAVVEAYGAKIGYQNSDVVSLIIPNP